MNEGWIIFSRAMEYRHHISGWWLYNTMMLAFLAGVGVGWLIWG